jgi:hypothetical protein
VFGSDVADRDITNAGCNESQGNASATPQTWDKGKAKMFLSLEESMKLQEAQKEKPKKAHSLRVGSKTIVPKVKKVKSVQKRIFCLVFFLPPKNEQEKTPNLTFIFDAWRRVGAFSYICNPSAGSVFGSRRGREREGGGGGLRLVQK